MKKKALLAMCLLMGAAVWTGCTSAAQPAATPQTAEKTTAEPPQEETPEPEESQTLALTVDGEEIKEGALRERDMILLPLMKTGEALGYEAKEETLEEEEQKKRTITLSKADSRITVSWVVADNTARQITWQKDGLLIPVDTELTTLDGVVYVPAAFFEEAMDAQVTDKQDSVNVRLPEPKDTPEMQEETK